MDHYTNIFAGFLAGLACAIGGAIKDSPYEGFKPATFPRSIWVGTLAGLVTSTFTDSFIIAVCCSGYLERCAVEGYKIIRHVKPGKFENGGVGHRSVTVQGE
jgi:hypothetical protein